MNLHHALNLHPTTSSGRMEAAILREQIRQKHAEHPEYNKKELAMVCFCGVNVVERALSQTN